ncbi:histidine kinase dimerization/phospho-acceptor domain-containing protein [Neobacillus sp. BF23-41]|uniref:histidine kinase dimerization/phospho-acceptor domain-containing protein n=1 Tax=Neobacillus sp. BF23-41 TaxID=3240280 RepID=UPI0034E4E35C
MEGKSFSKLFHPDDVCTIRISLDNMFNNNDSQAIEFRLLHKQGNWIELESHCMPVLGGDNTIEHIVMVSGDISNRKKSEQLLLQSEKLAIVGELAAGVAHEIRNTLTTLKGFVQLNRSECCDDKYSDLLISEIERIETITSELLTLGKPLAFQPNRMDVREIIELTLELLTPEFKMNNIHCKLSAEETPIIITCEKNQIKQVFLNVIKNSIEAMGRWRYSN